MNDVLTTMNAFGRGFWGRLSRGFAHAFALRWHESRLKAEDLALLDRFAGLLADRGLTTPAIFLLYPACPHITHALWLAAGYAQQSGDLLDAPWPEVDEAALRRDEIELVLQIAGKMRGAVRVAAGADAATIEAAALASPEFARFGGGKPARKVVVVPGRLVNVVV